MFFRKKQINLENNLLSKSFWGALAFLLFFGWFVRAENDFKGEVVINEVAWMGTTDSSSNEWIELKNLSNREIDLEGWSLESGDYKIEFDDEGQEIIDKKNKIELKGKIKAGDFYLMEKTDGDSTKENEDLVYSGSFNLSNGGEDLILRDSEGSKVDEVEGDEDWPAGDNDKKFTMERIDEDKWQDSFKKNGTPKKENSKEDENDSDEDEKENKENDNNIEEDEKKENEDENSNKEENQGNKDSEEEDEIKIKVIINEIAWMGTTESSYNEWIELKNLSEEKVDLDDWLLEISEKKIQLKGEIKKGGFYLLERTDDDSIDDVEANLIYTGGLSNNGEVLILKNSKGYEVDKIEGEDDWPAGNNDKKLTMERTDEGGWQDSFVVDGTPGKENSTKMNEEENDEQDDVLSSKIYSKELEMTELMPNPEGTDKNQEWIELLNQDDQEIELEGWYLSNQSSKKFKLDGLEIKLNQRLKVEIKNSTFSLRNSEGQVFLFNPNDKKVDEVEYIEKAKANCSWNKKVDGSWEWSIFSTPGRENKFNNPPTYKVEIPEKIYKEVKTKFKIIDAKDKDGEDLKYRWQFSTGKRSYIPVTTQTFDKKGNYTVEVRVGDASIDVFKSFKFRVESFPDFDLEIVKLLPNPKGSDSENEKIWIKNNDKKTVNLKDWIIATGKDSEHLVNHYIKDDLKIKAGKIKAVDREDCAFSLLNKKARIVLKSPNKETVSKVKYEKDKIEEDEIYLKQDNQWVWVAPLAENKLVEKKKIEVLGSQNDFKKVDFFEIINQILVENQRGSSSLKVICFKNWLYSQSEKPFFDLIFPKYFKKI